MASTTAAPPVAPDPQQSLYAALAGFQAEAGSVPKDARNPHFKNTYATLASVIAAVQPAASHGLSHSQTFEQTAEGATLLVTTIHHIAGACIRSTLPIGLAADWQKNGSAITYARRYALLAAFGLAPDDDDDGNTAAPAPAQPARSAAPRPAPRNGTGATHAGPQAAQQAPRDDRQITVATARKRLMEAGLTAEGASQMFAELSPGAASLDALPDPILRRFATTGASDDEISRWNAGQVDTPVTWQQPVAAG